MAFSRALLLKGLAGVAAVGAVGGGVAVASGMNPFKSKEQLEKERKDGERKVVNGKLEALGIECKLGEEEDPFVFSKVCGVDEGKLKKIKFSNKGEKDLVVKSSSDPFPADLKLKVERKDKEDISFSFTGLASGADIKVFGDKGKIVIKEDKKFKEKEERLTKSGDVNETLKGFNDQLEKVNAPLECRFDETEEEGNVECPISQDQLKGLKFSNKGEGDLKVVGTVKDGLKLKVEKEQEAMSLSFPEQSTELKLFGDKGKIVLKSTPLTKFKVEDGKLIKSSSTVDATLKNFNEQLSKVKAPVECRFDDTDANEAAVECDITSDQLKVMEFSNKGEKELKVKDWPTGGGVKLKVEKKTASPSAISLSLTGITGSDIKVFGDKGKIVIKNSETKFKVENGILTRESATAVDQDLKKFNEKLGKVNAPVECRFDDTNASEVKVECDVTKEDLKTMKFSDDKGELTYKEGDSFSGMKLEVKFNVEKGKEDKPGEKKVFYLIFKDFSETVKLSNGNNEVVSFIKNTNPEFVIEGDFLEKMWDVNALRDTLKLSCAVGSWECKIDESSNKVNVKNTSGEDFTAVDVDDPNSNTFKLHKDQEDYNQGLKFVFNGSSSFTSTGGSATLESKGEYEFKWKVQDKVRVGYLAKKAK